MRKLGRCEKNGHYIYMNGERIAFVQPEGEKEYRKKQTIQTSEQNRRLYKQLDHIFKGK